MSSADPGLPYRERLEAELAAWLHCRPEGGSEYRLMVEMQRLGALPPTPPGDDLALFRAHFLLFNALYRLRDELLGEGVGELAISALEIRLAPCRPGEAALARPDPLREYYLEMANLELDARGVEELLARFWGGLAAQAGRDEALEVLGLEADVDLPAIRRRYRRLVMEHHPDRGGDNERLQAINGAMAVLLRCYS